MKDRFDPDDRIQDIGACISLEGRKFVLQKYIQTGGTVGTGGKITAAVSDSEKSLMLTLGRYASAMEQAAAELAPHKICSYIYELANDFNRFYHETKILTHEDESQKKSWIALLDLTRRVLEQCINLLGFKAPDRM